jgi:NAD(P)-dependent dehydrogenase (short-subunit alcohol dehydrogenase family)
MAEGPPKLPLEGHIALITGASGGIGVATARLLASLGCSIAIHYNSDKETATFLQDELRLRYDNNLNANFIVAKADMGEYSEVCEPFTSTLSCPSTTRLALIQPHRSALCTPPLLRYLVHPPSSSTTRARRAVAMA